MLLDPQVCCDAIYFLAKFGEQLHAALATFVADVAGDLAFFLHLVEGCFQFGVNFEQAAVLCGQCICLHFQNLVTKEAQETHECPRVSRVGERTALIRLRLGWEPLTMLSSPWTTWTSVGMSAI